MDVGVGKWEVGFGVEAGLLQVYTSLLSVAQVNYTQPLVAVKFLNVTPNVEVNVECRINAANIATDDERDKFAGRVAFKLRINKT